MVKMLGRLYGRATGLAVAVADRAGTATRALPGAAGALMLAYGLGQAWQPAFWITLGLFALAIDRKMP
jgi:hypothetical protein